MIDLPAIRDRDAETERFPYRNPIPDGQRAIQDRRALLAEVDVLIRERDSAREALRVSEQHVRELGAHIESLQNRWASRPLSRPDGEALEKENERLHNDLQELTCGDERYTRLGRENERLRAEILDARRRGRPPEAFWLEGQPPQSQHRT